MLAEKFEHVFIKRRVLQAFTQGQQGEKQPEKQKLI